jgi:hypothetical protein
VNIARLTAQRAQRFLTAIPAERLSDAAIIGYRILRQTKEWDKG